MSNNQAPAQTPEQILDALFAQDEPLLAFFIRRIHNYRPLRMVLEKQDVEAFGTQQQRILERVATEFNYPARTLFIFDIRHPVEGGFLPFRAGRAKMLQILTQ